MEALGEAFSRDRLEEAWARVEANGGAAGTDGVSLSAYASGLREELGGLGHDLSTGVYRPMPYRAVHVPKSDGGRRRLVIACVRDRVAQTALTLWLQPHLEPLCHPCSFAYRPGRGVHDALAQVAAYRNRGLEQVYRADVEAFFDSVDHEVLLSLLGTAGVEDLPARLIRMWLSSVVVDDGEQRANPTVGLPQGLPIAPLLANLYLTPFDRALVEQGWKLVRYADDFVVCFAAAEEAVRVQSDAARALAPLKLATKDTKTHITSFAEGFTFLGALFRGAEILPATPHPYEEAFAPPPKASQAVAPPTGVPEVRLRTLYVQQQGAHIGRHGGRLVISRGNQTLLDLPAHHIDQIFLFGRVHLSAAAMAFCLMRRIPVHLFSGRGHYHGALLAVDGAEFEVERAQYRLLDEPVRRLAAARAIVHAKVSNSAQLLRNHAHNHPESGVDDLVLRLGEAGARAAAADSLEELRGVEGRAAAAYFDGFARCMRGPLQFNHRNRRPPLDPINSLLSFGYTLLLYQIHSCLAARQMDPAVGLFHEPGRGHPALASDMIEELRAPVVDCLILTLANRQQFASDDFYRAQGDPQPCLMKDPARERFLRAFEEKLADSVRHPEAEHPADWRHVIGLQAGRMRRFLLGQADAYVPYAWG